jgi:hypothetical protein
MTAGKSRAGAGLVLFGWLDMVIRRCRSFILLGVIMMRIFIVFFGLVTLAPLMAIESDGSGLLLDDGTF